MVVRAAAQKGRSSIVQGMAFVLLSGTCNSTAVLGVSGPARRWAVLLIWISSVGLWWSLFKNKVYYARIASRKRPTGRWVRGLAWFGERTMSPVRTPQPHLSLNKQAADAFQRVMRS